MGLMLMTGGTGPLLDTFFLGGKLDRRAIVATKATCQVASPKLIYFGGIISQAATLDPAPALVAVMASMLGTTLSRRLLESMSDLQFRYLGEPADHDDRRLLHHLWELAPGGAQLGRFLLERDDIALLLIVEHDLF
jgi:hypothetical protein